MKNTHLTSSPAAQPRWPDGNHPPQASVNRPLWRSTSLCLAAKTAASVAALCFGAGIAAAGLVLEMKPGDYDAGTKHWSFSTGSLAPDYFQSADWGNPTKTLIGNPGSSVAYSAVDCTTAGQGFAGPLCPASLGSNGPRTIEAWVYTPTASNGGVIFDPSRQYVEDQSPNPNVNYAGLFQCFRRHHSP